EAARVAAEAWRVLVHPGNGPAHLVGHDEKIAVAVAGIVEVEHHVMRADVDEHLCRGCVLLRPPEAPSAAVDEHLDMTAFRNEDVELLVAAFAVGKPLRLAQTLPRQRAAQLAPLAQLVAVRGVDRLVVGVVERLLVVVEKDTLHLWDASIRPTNWEGNPMRR